MQADTNGNLKPYIKIEGPEQPVSLHPHLVDNGVKDEIQELEDIRSRVDDVTHSSDSTLAPNLTGKTLITYPDKSRKFLEKFEFKKKQEKIHGVEKKIEETKPKNIFQRVRETIQERIAA